MYAVAVGAHLPVMRAALMFTLVIFAPLVARRANSTASFASPARSRTSASVRSAMTFCASSLIACRSNGSASRSRLFRTSNTEFIHTLVGNTQVMKQVRQVTKAMHPQEHAAWTLGELYAFLCVWAYDVYDQDMHLTLGMSPREAWRLGLMQSGERAHLTKLYEEEFRYLSLPTTKKGTAKVEPGRGVLSLFNADRSHASA